MAEFITDVIPPDKLTGYVRESLTDGDLPLGGLFPPTEVRNVEYELTNTQRFVGEVARYRAWDTAIPIGKRPGLSTITGEIPPLGWGYRLNEKDILQFPRIRQGIRDDFTQEVEDRIFNDAVNAAKAVQNRITLAQAELLTTGTVTLAEIGNPVTTNEVKAVFDVPAGHLGVFPAILWTVHATSVPITNLLAWEATFRSNNGGLNPTDWLMSSARMGDLVLSAQIKLLASGVPGTAATMITADTVRQVASAMGVNGRLVVIDEERPSYANDGTSARIIPADLVIGVRADALGSTFYGICPDAAMLASNGDLQLTDAPGIIAFQERRLAPAEVKTTAETLALPVLRDPAAMFVADVA